MGAATPPGCSAWDTSRCGPHLLTASRRWGRSVGAHAPLHAGGQRVGRRGRGVDDADRSGPRSRDGERCLRVRVRSRNPCARRGAAVDGRIPTRQTAESLAMAYLAELTPPRDPGRIDLLGTAYEIPAANDSFDAVLSTTVLEHPEEPAQALTEALRVLKPGGVAIYTASFIWHLQEEPRDFYRYSKHGLRHLFATAGFEVAHIE